MKAIPKRTLLVTCVIILLPCFFRPRLVESPARAHAHPFRFQRHGGRLFRPPFAVIGLPLFILAMQLFCAVMLRADPKKQNISEKMAQLIRNGSAPPSACSPPVHIPERAGLLHQRLAFRHDFRRPALHRHRQLSAQVPP